MLKEGCWHMGWQKGTIAKLEMMDRFMKDSQRVNAPGPSKFDSHAINIPFNYLLVIL